MQPLYYFLDFFLLVKYIDVWFEKGSFTSVVAMGYAVNMFALVRVFFKWILLIGMHYETSYDLSLMLAVVANLPVVLGPSGCIQLVSVVFLWNILLNVFLPGHRSLMQVNRTVADVFPDEFNGKPVNFAALLRKYYEMYRDEREAVARATFHAIAGDNSTIEVDEVEALFIGWGLPDGKSVAHEVFANCDENDDGAIDFEEFRESLSFIWERIHFVGESETNEDGSVKPTQIQEMKED
eukprot:CAMPEP_0172559462 /NCGR_PEP_ID=MMETSP1067-20121228/84100_1 /TAXON_ID=265564 ORGANISM="Thalassiosira punctigera, Strain Tpunct2005C2" /NCGR_SAMPLE_ID=MMETSP1067 /ASSEMBLY_ACC=CAM_ASM_000444 /LENGTH=237 /DNA_ID=CAMNT_0013349057 /DNA_START=452 /DNA_END=1165 /DNA_ORIENTATION=+